MQAEKAGYVDRRALGGGNVGGVLYAVQKHRVKSPGHRGKWCNVVVINLGKAGTRWHGYHLVICYSM